MDPFAYIGSLSLTNAFAFQHANIICCPFLDHPLLLLLLLPAAWAPGTCRGQFTLAACFLSMHCVSFWFGIQYLLCIERAIHWWRKCNWQWWQWRWCSHLWLEQVPIYFHQPPVCNRPVLNSIELLQLGCLYHSSFQISSFYTSAKWYNLGFEG